MQHGQRRRSSTSLAVNESTLDHHANFGYSMLSPLLHLTLLMRPDIYKLQCRAQNCHKLVLRLLPAETLSPVPRTNVQSGRYVVPTLAVTMPACFAEEDDAAIPQLRYISVHRSFFLYSLSERKVPGTAIKTSCCTHCFHLKPPVHLSQRGISLPSYNQKSFILLLPPP